MRHVLAKVRCLGWLIVAVASPVVAAQGVASAQAAVAVQAVPGAPTAAAARPFATVVRLLEVNGAKIHVETTGQGPPIVFLHGGLHHFANTFAILVMAGDKDFSSLEEVAEVHRGLPNAQLFIVPGSGHGTFSDRPVLVDLAIREFLD